MKILMVLTSHDQLGDTGKKTGFWLEEFAAPYYVFKDAGADITLATPKGGQPPLDPKSDAPDAQTDATRRFKADAESQRALASTVPLSGIRVEEYDAGFYPGGHGPLDAGQCAAHRRLLQPQQLRCARHVSRLADRGQHPPGRRQCLGFVHHRGSSCCRASASSHIPASYKES